jgi:protease I
MPTALMVIAPEVFRDEEYAEPKRVLEERGARVVTASTRPGACKGKLGMTATADISVSDALDGTWDAVLFIGGGGSSVFFDDEAAHGLASATLERGAIVGAICIAPSTLAHAGLLAGRRATAFESQEQDLVIHGAVWTDEEVTVDGRIVTANGPEAAEAFGVTIAELLGLLESSD